MPTNLCRTCSPEPRREPLTRNPTLQDDLLILAPRLSCFLRVYAGSHQPFAGQGLHAETGRSKISSGTRQTGTWVNLDCVP